MFSIRTDWNWKVSNNVNNFKNRSYFLMKLIAIIRLTRILTEWQFVILRLHKINVWCGIVEKTGGCQIIWFFPRRCYSCTCFFVYRQKMDIQKVIFSRAAPVRVYFRNRWIEIHGPRSPFFCGTNWKQSVH